MSMLDDFVEHAGGPSGSGYAGVGDVSGTLAGVEYEGFEPDQPGTEEVSGLVRALETGFIPSSRLSAALPPLFSLTVVQYQPPSDILALFSSNNVLFLATHPLTIVIIDLNNTQDLVTIDLPRPAHDKSQPGAREVTIRALYADPTARHLIITTSTGDAFYLPIAIGNPIAQSKRPRPLRLKQNITAVAWSPLAGADDGTKNETPTAEVLLGSSTGNILSLPLPPTDDMFKVNLPMGKQVERELQTVYTLPESEPVLGLAMGFWGRKEKKAWVVISTKDRIFEVQGAVTTTSLGGKGPGWAEEIFKPVREGAPKLLELPGNPPSSELRVYSSSSGTPSSIAWETAQGLYHSPLSAKATTEILYRPSLLPYPPAPEVDSPGFNRSGPQPSSSPPFPLSMAITQWHWLFLYSDRVVAVARESDKVVWDEPLPLAQGEKALGLAADPVSQTYWVYTQNYILEVVVKNEDRDVWRAKLEKGAFSDALAFATTPVQRDIIHARQGDALFDEGKYMLAARSYAESTKSFEYVTLRFMDADERDALRAYLLSRLDKLDKKDFTQRMMIATWLLEIYLSKCNTLEDLIAAESATTDVQNLTMEREMVEDDLKTFMKDFKSNLDPSVVYELILGHGRTDLYIYAAELNKDHAKVVEHWVTEEQWTKAIEVLSRQDSVELYYRFATLLMRNAPKATVDAWMRQSALVPRRLIPALLQQKLEPLPTNQAVRYLEHVIQRLGSTDSTIYNLLLTLYASDKSSDDGPLLRFLSSCPDDPITEKPYYDLDYALRLCKTHGRIQPCVHIYSRMGLYESSVDLALEKGDLELAKINADKPEDDDVLRRKLWLKIAKYVVQEKGDIKSAMKFLESTDLVKIEDILPFFPDFVVIDDFKTEICNALEDYSARIDDLKLEMAEATRSAESIKRDIEALATRFVAVEQSDKCWHCGGGITSRQFYVFPCQHSFHADCLVTLATEYLPAPSLRRLLHMQNELLSHSSDSGSRTLLSSHFQPGTPKRSDTAPSATDFLRVVPGRQTLAAAGDRLRELIVPDALAQAVSVVGAGVGVGGGRKKRPDPGDEARLEVVRKELDELIAAVCPLCEGSVTAVDKPFIRGDEDVSDWAV